LAGGIPPDNTSPDARAELGTVLVDHDQHSLALRITDTGVNNGDVIWNT
jgi:hypothetical protein